MDTWVLSPVFCAPVGACCLWLLWQDSISLVCLYGRCTELDLWVLKRLSSSPSQSHSSLLIQLSFWRSWNGMSLFLLEKLMPAGFFTMLLFRCLCICSGVLSFIIASFHVELSLTNMSLSAPRFTTGVTGQGKKEAVVKVLSRGRGPGSFSDHPLDFLCDFFPASFLSCYFKRRHVLTNSYSMNFK